MSIILQVESLSKSYPSGRKKLQVLENISFELEEGKTMSIVGPSGSGKTTLLGLCAGLDKIDDGSVQINGLNLTGMNEDALADLRNEQVGFIFQNFQLIPTLTAIENIMVPMELKRHPNPQKKALELLEQVGLADRGDHYPAQLSGGEQQRIAIARAFSNDPHILFADEPTGNLDDETGAIIEELIFELNKSMNTALVIVTHDIELANKTDNVIRLKGGKILTNDILTKTSV
ncbi:MAG: ABC transporter ATP-binding protein [Reichenbachiella sp.]